MRSPSLDKNVTDVETLILSESQILSLKSVYSYVYIITDHAILVEKDRKNIIRTTIFDYCFSVVFLSERL